jgi:hypothetical protein
VSRQLDPVDTWNIFRRVRLDGMADVFHIVEAKRQGPWPSSIRHGELLLVPYSNLQLSDIDRLLHRAAIAFANGNMSDAMVIIGENRSTFYRRMKEYGLVPYTRKQEMERLREELAREA